MAIDRLEQLEVWQEAHRMVLDVYRTAKGFPSGEKFGLVSQMRRAAVSVPASSAEGFKRRGLKDKSRYYNMAQGSLEELRYYFILSRDLSYAIPFDVLADRAERVGRMPTGLIHSLRA